MSEAIDPLIDWSADDKLWLDSKVPSGLQPVAKRYGRTIFTLVMHAGAANHALGVLARRARGHREQLSALRVLQGVLNELVISASGNNGELLAQCQQDVIRLVELSNGAIAPNSPISPGGILLDS